jgi:hypothetical protein
MSAGGWVAGDGTEGEIERERGCGWEKNKEREADAWGP